MAKNGIQANMKFHHSIPNHRIDARSTAKVEETRDMTNRKPFRNKIQKEEARKNAEKKTKGKHKGTWVSYTSRSHHPEVR